MSNDELGFLSSSVSLKVTTTSNSSWPIVGRWTRQMSEGTVTWFLARLLADRQFYGYVHIRTPEARENRSFGGVVDTDTFDQLTEQLDVLFGGNAISKQSETVSDGVELLDGLLGVGTRNAFDIVIQLHNGALVTGEEGHIGAYMQFINLIEPILAKNLE